MTLHACPAKRGLLRTCAPRQRQRGATMTEFVVVAPILTLLGLAVLQYGLLFFAKNQVNHATFMAARAGTTANADLGAVRRQFARAAIPLYGGGRDSAELARAYARSSADIALNTRIELLNPTRESFDDWSDSTLQHTVGSGRRVIPNRGLAFRDPNHVKQASGQSIHDANLIKIRVTYGYAPTVPLIRLIYARYLRWLDPGNDPFHTFLVNTNRIPVVSHATLHMQSDAIEPGNPVSLPGPGNNGQPTDPGAPPQSPLTPPDCLTVGCTVANTPVTHPPPPGDGSTDPDLDPGAPLPPCDTGA